MIAEAVLQYQPNISLGKVYQKILVGKRSKRRGDELLKTGSNK